MGWLDILREQAMPECVHTPAVVYETRGRTMTNPIDGAKDEAAPVELNIIMKTDSLGQGTFP